MKKILSNIKLLRRISTFALIGLMAIATAVSFVFWKSGVSGATQHPGFQISIGEGISADGSLEITPVTNNINGGKLIPIQRVNEYLDNNGDLLAGYITEITYEFTVAWINESSTGLQGTQYRGELSVTWVSAYLNDDVTHSRNLKNDKSKYEQQGNENKLPLFNVDIEYASEIFAQDRPATTTNTVKITIQLNEPVNSELYHYIANGHIDFNFKAEVLADNEK